MLASQITIGGEAGGAADWTMSIDRGPDWLFIRLEPPHRPGDTAAIDRLDRQVWQAIREHGAHRVVLELERVQAFDDDLIEMIAAVGARVRDDGGMLRVCGLSRPNIDHLRRSPHAADVPHFATRSEAVVARGSLVG